ncbi:MAG: diguanylate cyclase [Rhodocyclaceae bacterium]
MSDTPFRALQGTGHVDLERLREIIDLNSDWIWEVDDQGRYVYSSAKGESLLGRPTHEIIGKTPFDFMPPDEAERIGRAFGAIAAKCQPFSGLVNRNMRPDGTIVVLETSGVPLFWPTGEFKGYRGIDRDVTALGARLFQLEASYASAPVALYVIDRELRYVAANDALARMYGCQVEDIIGHHVREFFDAATSFEAHDFELLDAGLPVPSHELMRNGRFYQVSVQPIRDMAGGIIGLTNALMDITERKLAEQALAEANQRLQQYANEDYLTGLLNRRRFDEVLAEEISRAQRHRLPMSVIMADVDYFKTYNDHYGHLAGDACLRAAAAVFRECLQRPSDAAGRYGGEEFGVILPGTDGEGAAHVAENIRAALQARALPHEGSIFGCVTMSFGVATLPVGEFTLDPAAVWTSLIARADAALYDAKAAGRNRVR